MKIIFTILILCSSILLLHAQAPSDILSKQETDSLIINYCTFLNENYFNKKMAKEITATLQRKLKAGDFYNVTQLTDRLSLLLREQTKDIHFYIGKNMPETTTDQSNETTEAPPFHNGGFSEVRIIDKSVGYIKWNDFIADETSFQKLIAALEFVKGCQYLIIDLSECPGGDGKIGGFMNRHLFEKDDYQNLLQKKCNGEKDWHQSEVVYNYSNGPKLYDVPLFIITSKHTASAAEYFALTIKEMKRGTLLGETTAGAGNPVTMVTFGHYFAYIPICEITYNNGHSIEGIGVVPNVKLASDDWLKETLAYIKTQHSKQ